MPRHPPAVDRTPGPSANPHHRPAFPSMMSPPARVRPARARGGPGRPDRRVGTSDTRGRAGGRGEDPLGRRQQSGPDLQPIRHAGGLDRRGNGLLSSWYSVLQSLVGKRAVFGAGRGSSVGKVRFVEALAIRPVSALLEGLEAARTGRCGLACPGTGSDRLAGKRGRDRGVGGLRKLRFSPPGSGRGKSGSYRVCYAHYPAHGTIALFVAFGKNERSDISPAEARAAAAALKVFEVELHRQIERSSARRRG